MNKSREPINKQIYWRLMAYLRPYKYMLLFSIVGSIIFAASSPAFAHLIKLFVEALENPSQANISLIPIAIIIVSLIRGLGNFISSYYIGRTGELVIHTIRCTLFDKLLLLPKSFFDNKESGHLISLLTYNVQQLNEAISHAVLKLLQDGLIILGLMSYMLWLNWQLSLIFLIVVPPIGYLASRVGRQLRTINHSIQDSMGELAQVSVEAINNLQVIRNFGGYGTESRRFEKVSLFNRSRCIKLIRTIATMSPLVHTFIAIAMALIMLAMLYFRSNNSTAELIAFIVASAALPGPIRSLGTLYSKIMRSLAAAESLFSLIDTDTEADLGSYETDRVSGHLQIKGLNFSYPNTQKTVLQHIDIDIPAGATVALVGYSGSGKSTLAALILRYYNYTEGCIYLDGRPITDYRLSNLRQQIAKVSQNVTLFDDSIRNNIAYGDLNNASEQKLQQVIKAAHIDEFITHFPKGYDTLVGENGLLLSSGQRQRVSIARAMLKDAPILILDEATSALDNKSELHIQTALNELMAKRTTLVIAHRLSTVKRADNIIVMDKGRLVEQGSHEELLRLQGHYSDLYHQEFTKDNG